MSNDQSSHENVLPVHQHKYVFLRTVQSYRKIDPELGLTFNNMRQTAVDVFFCEACLDVRKIYQHNGKEVERT